MELDPRIWIGTLRKSHDRLARQTIGLDITGLERQSACSAWTVAQVLSHLGSQAEIFSMILRAGLSGATGPSNDAFPPIWSAWDARSPQEQARDSIEANEVFVSDLESLDDKALEDFRVDAFGMNIDAVTLCRLRLSEHAIHAWDIAVAFETTAKLNPDTVELILDSVLETASRVGKAMQLPLVVRIQTDNPSRDLALIANGVRIEQWAEQESDATLRISAEELIRLIYGRLREADAPQMVRTGNAVSLNELRAIFPGV